MEVGGGGGGGLLVTLFESTVSALLSLIVDINPVSMMFCISCTFLFRII